MIRLIPVSYTHLDVYKRQEHTLQIVRGYENSKIVSKLTDGYECQE